MIVVTGAAGQLGIERMTGRPATSVRELVSLHAGAFGGRGSRRP